MNFFYNLDVEKAFLEDLIQDTFIALYQNKKYHKKSTSEQEKILFGIAKNVYRMWVSKRVKELNMSEHIDRYADPEIYSLDNFQDENLEKELVKKQEIVNSAIKKLNPTVQQVIQMRFVEKLSRKEIAEKLGIKEKDVHTYQKRGIKYLNKMINIDNKSNICTLAFIYL